MQKIFIRIIRNVNTTYLFIIFFLCAQSKQLFCQQAAQDLNKIRTVIIDAGHGGKDPGAVGENSVEKDLALAISLKAGKYIEERIPDVKVYYTRTKDEFIPLYERAKLANDNDADLFISIHINSSTNKAASGTESLVLGLHRSDENFEVAKRENQVILLEENYTVNYEGFDPNSEESYIMFSLMQNIYDEHSISFAENVQSQFRERAGRKDRGVHRQGLLVLAQSAMPGILIEAGFISNKTEEQYMMTEEGQDYLASAIFRAFRDYKELMEGNSPISMENDLVSKDRLKTTSQTGLAISEPLTDSNKSATISESTSNYRYNAINKPDTLFKIQILFSENKIEPTNPILTEFNDIEELTVDGKYKYVVGSETSYTRAVELNKTIKKQYPDAFIVAVCKGKIIPLSEALKIKEN